MEIKVEDVMFSDVSPVPKDKNQPGSPGNTGQLLALVRRSLLFYINWYYLRPRLKRLLPSKAHTLVRLIRSRFQPSLSQYPPIPLKIPEYYHRNTLPQNESLPAVSIVTPSLNQAQFLEGTIKSVIGQNYPKLEYIIRDGGSMDGTQKILERYQSVLRHFESSPDKGQAHAINLGFRHASGDIMAWINSDDLLLPGTIPYVVNFFLEHPEIDVVYGYRICIDDHDYEIGRWILPPHDDTILPWANYVPQETLFWRRRIWEKAGGYVDESFQFAMDWELLLRFHNVGATFARLPRFLGAFRVHAAQKTTAWEKIGRQEAARLHTLCHGRTVEWLEVRYHVRQYLMRTAWLMLRYRLGLLRF